MADRIINSAQFGSDFLLHLNTTVKQSLYRPGQAFRVEGI